MNYWEGSLLIIFIIYGVPLLRLRYKFRAAVYDEKGWQINIKPWFVKETVSLFSNKYLQTKEKQRIGKVYRIYLAIYFCLLALLIIR